MRAWTVLNAIADGESEEEMEQLMTELRRVRDRAPEVEVGFLTHRLADFERYLGADHPVTQAALGGLDPEAAARQLKQQLSGSACKPNAIHN
mgnify:CR=1 FL=1